MKMMGLCGSVGMKRVVRGASNLRPDVHKSRPVSAAMALARHPDIAREGRVDARVKPGHETVGAPPQKATVSTNIVFVFQKSCYAYSFPEIDGPGGRKRGGMDRAARKLTRRVCEAAKAYRREPRPKAGLWLARATKNIRSPISIVSH